MWQELGIAFCLLLVLEGILPFLYPRHWRGALAQMTQLSDRQLRLMADSTTSYSPPIAAFEQLADASRVTAVGE